ncbi:ABC transporter substrate-binding protein [Humisphaera borealis]|uniref:Spermidine/putrescine ABC transporter substrate-binding protein n=1 Tax=Humisphaera borealis TaxID=2807512 RepID=A0A7M2WR49_9BACT|nr:spermidine/putrescine ABC transporter substrate-binding protein [Humisphaera borealis]QOV87946.1 spermidine/putrescine ABC transporter substrate-binding protein [Humisphaera borealis]
MPNRRSRLSLIVPLLVALVPLIGSIGCKKDPAPTPAAQADDKKVNLLIFSEYIPDDVLADFKKETGIEVAVAVMESNEQLLAKLAGGSNEFDVVSPSDYMVRRLAAQKLIQKFDRAKLSNFSNLDPTLLGKGFDTANEFSVPLFWGTTGIGYNKKKVTDPVNSWAILFDPKYKGKVAMLNDPREMVTSVLRRDGKEPNSKDPAILNAAIEVLKLQKKAVAPIYDVDGIYEKLAAGDVALAQGFNGQFYKEVVKKPEELGFIVPKEGATLWIDNLSIPTASTRVANAHKLVDFLMRPDVAARAADFAAYATPNRVGRSKVKKELLDNPIIYPPADVLKKCASMEDLGTEANKIMDRVTTEVNAD